MTIGSILVTFHFQALRTDVSLIDQTSINIINIKYIYISNINNIYIQE